MNAPTILEFPSFELVLSAVAVAMKILRRVSPPDSIQIAESVLQRSLTLYRQYAPQFAIAGGDALIQTKLVQCVPNHLISLRILLMVCVCPRVKTLEDVAVAAVNTSQKYLSARAYLREAKEFLELVKVRHPTSMGHSV